MIKPICIFVSVILASSYIGAHHSIKAKMPETEESTETISSTIEPVNVKSIPTEEPTKVTKGKPQPAPSSGTTKVSTPSHDVRVTSTSEPIPSAISVGSTTKFPVVHEADSNVFQMTTIDSDPAPIEASEPVETLIDEVIPTPVLHRSIETSSASLPTPVAVMNDQTESIRIPSTPIDPPDQNDSDDNEADSVGWLDEIEDTLGDYLNMDDEFYYETPTSITGMGGRSMGSDDVPADGSETEEPDLPNEPLPDSMDPAADPEQPSEESPEGDMTDGAFPDLMDPITDPEGPSGEFPGTDITDGSLNDSMDLVIDAEGPGDGSSGNDTTDGSLNDSMNPPGVPGLPSGGSTGTDTTDGSLNDSMNPPGVPGLPSGGSTGTDTTDGSLNDSMNPPGDPGLPSGGSAGTDVSS